MFDSIRAFFFCSFRYWVLFARFERLISTLTPGTTLLSRECFELTEAVRIFGMTIKNMVVVEREHPFLVEDGRKWVQRSHVENGGRLKWLFNGEHEFLVWEDGRWEDRFSMRGPRCLCGFYAKTATSAHSRLMDNVVKLIRGG